MNTPTSAELGIDDILSQLANIDASPHRAVFPLTNGMRVIARSIDGIPNRFALEIVDAENVTTAILPTFEYPGFRTFSRIEHPVLTAEQKHALPERFSAFPARFAFSISESARTIMALRRAEPLPIYARLGERLIVWGDK